MILSNKKIRCKTVIASSFFVQRVCAVIIGLAAGCGFAGAITPVEADAIFEAHTKAFYRVENGRGWHTKNTEGGRADFWMQAEMLEMARRLKAPVLPPELVNP